MYVSTKREKQFCVSAATTENNQAAIVPFVPLI